MKKSELIKKLQEIPGDPEVAVMDFKKNVKSDSGDGSQDGIHPFEVDFIGRDDLPEGHQPWIALTFQK